MADNISCEMPDSNPLDNDIKLLLENSKTIAVVGLSDKEDRDSYKVAKYLMDNGYTVIPVNPTKTEILGQKSYKSLSEVPQKIDIVDIFRKIDAVPSVVEEAISVDAKSVWMQLGLAHHDSAEKARKAGLQVVQSKCIKIEHKKLFA